MQKCIVKMNVKCLYGGGGGGGVDKNVDFCCGSKGNVVIVFFSHSTE